MTWLRPEATAGLPMLPPTRVTLRQVEPYPTTAAVLSASALRDAATPLIPRLAP